MIAAAVLAVVLVAAAVLYWNTSPAATTRSVTAAAGTFPLPPAAAVAVPAAFTPGWRRPSAATAFPLVAGPAVVTADAGTVTGRDAATGAEQWSYTRTAQICTAAAGFGDVLALYRNEDATACSELTALDPGSGARRVQANPVAYPGVRLITNGTLVAATGHVALTVMRSDLVRTTEYGDVATPVQPHRQPRPGCEYGSFAMTAGRLAVVERCADDAPPGQPHPDRLTALRPDGGSDATSPEVVFSTLLPSSPAQLVAASGDLVAVAAPGPPHLEIVDGTGEAVTSVPLAVPDADLAADPPDGVSRTSGDDRRLYWWSGSATVALDRATLQPDWTVAGTLGAGVRYADSVLVPVPSGLAVVDPATGRTTRTIPVDRGGWAGPVALGVQGSVLLEQRGPTLAALRPS